MASRKKGRGVKGRPDAHEFEMQRSLDRYSVKLIKVIGVVGVALGLVILIAFWYWVMGKLFSI